MNNKKRQTVIAVIGLLGVLAIISGVTYAWFSYSKDGTQENTITSGKVKFLYTEVSGIGAGIALRDAMPMTDAQGKAQSNYFDFKINADTGNSFSVPYTVTVRVKNADAANLLDPSVVKVWLSDQSNQVLDENSTDATLGVRYFQDTNPTSRATGTFLEPYSSSTFNPSDRYNERVLFTGTVPAGSTDYERLFRLRLWIDQNTDYAGNQTVAAHCSDSTITTGETDCLAPKGTWNDNTCSISGITDQATCIATSVNSWIPASVQPTYPFNGKQLVVTVNVYANGEVVSEDVTFSADEVSYTPPASSNSSCTTLDCSLDELETMLGN